MAPTPSKACATRLTKELRSFRSAPPPLAPLVHVDESNLLEWHVLIEGARETPYEGGWYVMRIRFKAGYPFQAPAVSMLTPNGRFAVGQSVCMSMTEWHQESWNPAWSASCIVTGFISFMNTDELTSGGVRTTDAEKKAFAANSVKWNAGQPGILKKFPELKDDAALDALRHDSAKDAAKDAAAATTTTTTTKG